MAVAVTGAVTARLFGHRAALWVMLTFAAAPWAVFWSQLIWNQTLVPPFAALALGGLDRPTAGRIVVNRAALQDMDENALAAYRREIVGFVFQSFNLIPSLSAWENVAFPMRFAGVPRRERRERAYACLLYTSRCV